MREDVRLEICGLGKLLVAAVKWTDIRAIASVNANVSAVANKKEFYSSHFMIVVAQIIYRKLKSSENRFPQPSKVHWNGFSPVCTSWWRFNFELSTNALPVV